MLIFTGINAMLGEDSKIMGTSSEKPPTTITGILTTFLERRSGEESIMIYDS